MQKNDPNLQKRSDFWLVGEARHEIRGKRPYGNLWGTYGLRGGPKIANLEAQKHKKWERMEKMKLLCRYVLFSGKWVGQNKKLGAKDYMGTIGVLLASGLRGEPKKAKYCAKIVLQWEKIVYSCINYINLKWD